MKKLVISLFSLPVFLLVFWCGLYLGDLASIGGYDGFAPEELAREFWYGRYSAWHGVVEFGAKAALGAGLAGAASSLVAATYFAREMVR
jgi:hypothetical protein